MSFALFLKESISGSFDSVITMAIIIIPLMVAMEMLKVFNILNIISRKMEPISRFFGMSDKAIFPLMIGMFFGLSYGAGVIIESAEEGNLGKKDLYILMVFLSICHAVVEDTLLFVALGANLWILFGIRLGVAILIAFFLSKMLNKRELNNSIIKFPLK